MPALQARLGNLLGNPRLIDSLYVAGLIAVVVLAGYILWVG